VWTGTYRTDPGQKTGAFSDFYSPKIQQGSIRPGTAIYDVNGHVGIVYDIEADGRIDYMDAHPDFSVTRSTYGAQFGQSPAHLGGGIKNPEDARTINNRARQLGFSTSIGIIHDGSGRLKPLGPVERKVFDEVSAAISGAGQVLKNLYSGIRSFQDNLADGQPNEWRCRAGARYLYICEEGLVHYCSQQRGYPGVPLEAYTVADIRREFSTPKSCAPYCTVGCVHRVSTMDFWRSPQEAVISQQSQSQARP
jgi:hypothetical protein